MHISHLITAATLAATVSTSANAQCHLDLKTTLNSFADFSAPGIEASTILNDRLFVSTFAASGSDPFTLTTFDITDPSNPTVVGVSPPSSTDPFGSELITVGDLLIANPNSNLQIYSVANPNALVALGSIDLPGISGNFRSYETDGVYIYALISDGSVRVVDISDPLNPSIVASVGSGASEIGAPARGLLPINGSGGLQIIDVSDPRNPSIAGSAPTDNSLGIPVIVGNAVVINSLFQGAGAELEVFDITDPTSPVELAGFPDPVAPAGRYLEHGRASGVIYYAVENSLGNGPSTMYAIDFTDPAAPMIVDTNPNFAFTGNTRRSRLNAGVYLQVTASDIALVDVTTCTVQPVVTFSPSSAATDEGGSPVVLDALTTGAITFQWLKDGQPIADGTRYSGSTTGTLTIQPDLEAAGVYRLRVSNPNESTLSSPAVVAVRPDPNAPLSPDFNNDGFVDVFDITDLLDLIDAVLP